MTKHYKVYSEYFDYAVPEEIMCEACGSPAVDIHHIEGRIGEDADNIKNLMALCRRCHDKVHGEKISRGEMQLIHNYFLTGKRIQFLK